MTPHELLVWGFARSRAIEASQREDQHAAEVHRNLSAAAVKRDRAKREARAYAAEVRGLVA